MDSAQTAKKLLGEVFPEISRRVRSTESRKLTCECGNQHYGTVWIYDDKTERVPRCRECQEKEKRQLEIDEWKRKLPEMEKARREDWRDTTATPLRYDGSTFANFDRKLQPKAWATMQAAADGKTSVILSSPGIFGVGKTHLCCALAFALMDSRTPVTLTPTGLVESGSPVDYWTETGLIRDLRATFNEGSKKTESDIQDDLRFIDVLIIDDVGKVRPRDSSYLQGAWFEIVDNRYNDSRPLILATNLSLPELEAHIGGACADRLREMCGKNIITMSGKSYRQKGPQP